MRSHVRSSVLAASAVALASLFACSGTATNSGFNPDGGASSGGGSGGSGSGSSGSGSSSGLLGGSSSGGSGGSSGATGDGGYVCAPNPLNYEIPGNGCDDDGDGKVDNAAVPCDTGTMPPSNLSGAGTAADILAAMGICQAADATHWGIVSATYTNGHSQTTAPTGNNFNEQHGTLGTFGSVIKPREGSLLGVLSSGSASATDSDEGPQFKGEKDGMQGSPPISIGGTKGNGGDVPAGFPKSSTGCATLSNEVNDVINVKAQIKVPANAKGFSFDFDFWSGEWPDYVCTTFNDSFIAYLTSKGFNGGAADNISFDTKGNTISVDNNFFQSCTPSTETGCSGGTEATATCSLGAGELAGTGFGTTGKYCKTTSTSGGATSWLTSTAPIQPGETITIEFLIWDTGDASYDSSVLLDNWTWQPDEVASTPITQPSPPIK
jgi:hypothetical protein